MGKGLYLHIPFCEKICAYCDFPKYVIHKSKECEYIDALLKEFFTYKDYFNEIDTIYIGGGTPSYLNKQDLNHLLSVIEAEIDLTQIKEYTIESNPRDITDEFLELIKNKGITRVSVGVQSFQPHLLKVLGRNHDKDDAIQAIRLLRSYGFDNFNLDFIYAIPSENLQDVKRDLELLMALNPNHISLYSLILEEKTILYHQVLNQEVTLVDEDSELEMVDYIHQTLKEHGYHHYEISNYAKPGFESLHNLKYWNIEDYIGIGLGSASLLNGHRSVNYKTLDKYVSHVMTLGNGFEEEEPCDLPQEYLLLGLRKMDGVSVQGFTTRFGKDLFTQYPKLKKFVLDGLLIQEGDTLRFSKRGIYLSNQVFVELI